MLPVIGLVCLGAACLAKPKRKQRRNCDALPTKWAAPCAAQVCEDLPWVGDAVTAVMVDAYQNGERNAERLAVSALTQVYPVSPNGQPLRWPTTYADCDQMKVLESRVMLRAQRLVAEALDQEAEALWYSQGGY